MTGVVLDNPRYILGLDADGWLREITVNDADPGLEITQAGAGAALRLATGHMIVATGESIDLYNTADEVTDYERLRLYWTANHAYLTLQAGGAGSGRNLSILSTNDLILQTAANQNMEIRFGGAINIMDVDAANAIRAKIISNLGYSRWGDAGTPTVSLEAANGFLLSAGVLTLADTTAIGTALANGDYFRIMAVDDDTNTLTELARATGASQPSFDLLLARFGVAALGADAAHRGMLYFTEGAGGVADKLYCIMKAADNSYSAIQVAIG